MKFKLGNIKGPKGDPGPMGPQGPKGDSSNISFPETENLLKSQNFVLSGGIDELLSKLVANAGGIFKKDIVDLRYARDDGQKKLYLTGNEGFTVVIKEKGREREVTLPQKEDLKVDSLGVQEFKLEYKNLLGNVIQSEVVPTKSTQKVVVLEKYGNKTVVKIENKVAFVDDSTGRVGFDDRSLGKDKDKFLGVEKVYVNTTTNIYGKRAQGNFNFFEYSFPVKEIYVNGDWNGSLYLPSGKPITVYNYKEDKKYSFNTLFSPIINVVKGEPIINQSDPWKPVKFIKSGSVWIKESAMDDVELPLTQ